MSVEINIRHQGVNTYSSARSLLVMTAATEVVAGLALISGPSSSMVYLVGMPVQLPAALTIARICGAALISLGIACWQARDDVQSPAARGVIFSMLFYDVAAVVVLAYAGIGFQLQGLLLWPGVTLHSLMTVWCIISIKPTPTSEMAQSGMCGSSSIHAE